MLVARMIVNHEHTSLLSVIISISLFQELFIWYKAITICAITDHGLVCNALQEYSFHQQILSINLISVIHYPIIVQEAETTQIEVLSRTFIEKELPPMW